MGNSTKPKASTREIELSAGPIRYLEYGSGRPMVFVHGLLANGSLWRNVAPRLAETHRCLVPDWPLGSHPMPMNADADLTPKGVARLIAEFMDRLELEDVVLVANDSGGAIAQLLVVERPDRIGHLILTSCDSFDNFLPPLFRPLQVLCRVPGVVAVSLQALRFRPLVRLPIALGFLAKRPMPRQITEAWFSPARTNRMIRRDTVRFLQAIDARDTLAAAKRFHEFGQPVSIIWASEDRVFPKAHATRLASLFPDATVELVPDSYAFIPEDQPERLATLIGESVTRTRTPATDAG